MKLFEKLFCKHQWKVHASRKMQEYRPKTITSLEYQLVRDYTIEVLICEHCGKIKTIEY